MTKDRRIDRLMPFLSAKERAVLTLRDLKAGKPQDCTLLHTAPEKQAQELNRLIGLMNAANGDLAHVVVIIKERAEKEALRFAWMDWARMCATEMWAIGVRFNLSAREPITESEYRQKEQEARKELIPIDECAMLYTEEHHVWEAADCETDDEGDEVPTDEAWYRVRDAKLAEIKELLAAGKLKGSGKGKRLKIECGSFYDWLPEPVPVPPELGIEYDMQPDHREREVERARKDHAFIRGLLDRGACDFELPLDMESPLLLEPPPRDFGVELARILATALRTGVQENWRELRAVEEQIETMTEAFDGEDVLHERMRGYLDEAKTTLIDLHEQVQTYTGPFELPEPDDELRAMVERIVEREAGNVPTR